MKERAEVTLEQAIQWSLAQLLQSEEPPQDPCCFLADQLRSFAKSLDRTW
jgi:hypothetical protein